MREKIAANASFLCLRTLVTVVANFYAVRLTLKALGVDGYGAFVAIGTVVAVARMFYGALESTGQRFIGTELGRDGGKDVQGVFSALLALTLAFAALMTLVLETAGLWFVLTCLDLPSEVEGVVASVYHVSVFMTVVGIVQVPFSALIISGERMSFFARICVVEAAVTVVSALLARNGILVYAQALAIGSLLVFALFVVHCRARFGEIRPVPAVTAPYLGRMLRFFAWGMLSGVGNAFKNQAVPLLLNVRCGVAFNATWSVALRTWDFFLPVCLNILQATAPAVYKAWGGGNGRLFRRLTRNSLFVAGVTVLVPAAAAFAFAPELVDFWLGAEAPPLVVPFIRCSLVGMVADAFSQPLTTAINASGRVARYQVVASSMSVASAAAAWCLLTAGCPPWTAMLAISVFNVLACAYRYAYVFGRNKGVVHSPQDKPAYLAGWSCCGRAIGRLLVAACFLGATPCLAAEEGRDFAVATDGTLAADIVLPERPSDVERYAAQELGYHLERAFGSKAQILTEDRLGSSGLSRHFFVGRTRAAQAVGLPGRKLAPDERLVRTVGDGLYLIGNDSEIPHDEIFSTWLVHSLGTLYAVYDFLETEMDVKWLWPGVTGEVIPRRMSLSLRKIDRGGVEPLEERFWGGAGFWGRAYGFTDMKSLRGFYAQQARFLVRHRVGRRRKINCGHSFNDWWQRFGKTHPEYFNLLPDGTRRPFADPTLVTMCCSNPDVWRQKAADWHGWWLKRGKSNGFEPWVNCCENDSAGLCQCPNCRGWDPPDPRFGQCPYWRGGMTRQDLDDLCRTNTKYSLTWLVGDNRWDIPKGDSNLKPTAPLGDRYANFYNHVLAEARKLNPDAKVIGYAYENYVEAPQATRVDPGVAIEFVPRSYFPYDRTESEFFRRHWIGWRNAGVREISYRPNYTLAGGGFLFDQGSLILEDFAFAYTNGMKRCLFDSLRGAWAAQTLTSYALTRAFRDPLHGYRRSREEVVSAFGSAREAVAEYLDGIREQTTKWTFADVRRMAWENHTGICGGGSHGNGAAILGDFLDDAFLEKCHLRLDAAVRAAGDDPEVLARIGFLRKGLRDTEFTRNTRLAQKRWEADPDNREKKRAFDDAFRAMNAYRASVENDCVCNFNFEAANERTGLHWPHVCIGGEKE